MFSSTLIPGDPDYLPTLAGYFPSAGYEAVIVSFGSHVTNKVSAISVDDFRKNYMAFVSQLSKRCRFLILATSTSIMDGPDGTLNEEKRKPSPPLMPLSARRHLPCPARFFQTTMASCRGADI